MGQNGTKGTKENEIRWKEMKWNERKWSGIKENEAERKETMGRKEMK